ncbi:MAG TPA: hypothetical protein VG963_27620, partial [Polyangiaceae bacterium]|nr:hypothetical protein [Polyangiaceae bacterium]
MARSRAGRLIVGIWAALASCTSGATKEGVLPGVDSVVFVKRAYLRADGTHEVTGGVSQVFDYDRY